MSPIDQENLLQKLLKKAAHESLISFTAGFPAEELLPIAEIRNCYQSALSDQHILQYSHDPKGDHSLRIEIYKRLALKQMKVSMDDILVTTGSSQAIDLITRVNVNKGDVVLVENPTYQEVLKLLHLQGVKIVGVESDWEGMNIEDLEYKIKKFQPKLVYVNPTFGNPNGKTWSMERRKKLIEVCANAKIRILEDDPYSELSFQKDIKIPTLFELDHASDHSHVIYVSTFSKIIAPSVRVGYIVANPKFLNSIVHLKHLSVIHSGIIDQRAIAYYLQEYQLDERLSILTDEYQSRLLEMENELKIQFRDEIKWKRPLGGIYLWLEIPSQINSMMLLERAIKNGVSYFPGRFFYVEQPDVNGIRLNFTYPSKEKIRIGIQKLAHVYKEVKESL